ncbi:MAG TPA: ribbon-helix-helix domain-containing protein [Solirubrobacterales bacterium]|nr:ribbon-helix-helix domain-containing protein [Solirubrobacterales bacterium]
MPQETWNGRRTTISVKLSDEDLAKLDELAEAEYGVPMGYHYHYRGTPRKRSEVLRQAIRDAKVPKKK